MEKRTIEGLKKSIQESDLEIPKESENSDFTKKALLLPGFFNEGQKIKEYTTFKTFTNFNEDDFFKKSNCAKNPHENQENISDIFCQKDEYSGENPFDPFKEDLDNLNPFEIKSKNNDNNENNEESLIAKKKYLASIVSIYDFSQKKYISKGNGTVSIEKINNKDFIIFRGPAKNILFMGEMIKDKVNCQESSCNPLDIVVNKLITIIDNNPKICSMKIKFKSSVIKENFTKYLTDEFNVKFDKIENTYNKNILSEVNAVQVKKITLRIKKKSTEKKK